MRWLHFVIEQRCEHPWQRFIMHLSAFRSSDLSDPLGRYYTPSELSRLLVDQIAVRRPDVVLDLGAGDGALSRAAQNRWHDARILAVESHRDARASPVPQEARSKYLEQTRSIRIFPPKSRCRSALLTLLFATHRSYGLVGENNSRSCSKLRG